MSKTQEYDKTLLVAVDGEIQYTAKRRWENNNDRVALFYSLKNGPWSPGVRGKLALSIGDDGNGVDVHLSYGKEIRLDYCELEELRAALNLISTSQQKVYELK